MSNDTINQSGILAPTLARRAKAPVFSTEVFSTIREGSQAKGEQPWH
jgi:hypothetical protein